MTDPILEQIQSLPIDLQYRAAIRLKQDLFKRSLYHTAKYLCGYSGISMSTHGPIIDALESPTKRKLIVMPRGSFKSSLCTVAFPIWALLKNPNETILIDSELYSNSKNFLREIKMHLGSEDVVSTFGIFKTEECWNETEIIIRNRTAISKEASITASGIGSEKTGQHFSLVICDDLNSPNNSSTKEGRQKVCDHYRYLNAILNPGGTLIVVGTRYSSDDAIGFVIDNEILINEQP